MQKGIIEKALVSKDKYVQEVAIKKCRLNTNFSTQDINDWREAKDLPHQLAAIYLRKSKKPEHFAEILAETNQAYGYRFACEVLLQAYSANTNLWSTYPPSEFGEYYTEKLVKKAMGSTPISTKMVKIWAKSDKWYDKISALYACILDPMILPTFEAAAMFEDAIDKEVINAAIIALRSKELPGESLQNIYNKADSITKRVAATKLFYGRKDAILNFDPERASDEEIKALAGICPDKKRTETWWSSDQPRIQAAAIYACKDSDMPFVFFNKALRSTDPFLHEAGLVATYSKKDFEPVRQIDPEVVYKKCVGNIIVKGTIPKNTSIRITGKNQGRADKFYVEKITGDFYGEKIGMSFFDCDTQYQEGFVIRVSDFNPSCAESTTGIHFFTNEEDARKFYY